MPAMLRQKELWESYSIRLLVNQRHAYYQRPTATEKQLYMNCYGHIIVFQEPTDLQRYSVGTSEGSIKKKTDQNQKLQKLMDYDKETGRHNRIQPVPRNNHSAGIESGQYRIKQAFYIIYTNERKSYDQHVIQVSEGLNMHQFMRAHFQIWTLSVAARLQCV